jgi:hypothetical protein
MCDDFCGSSIVIFRRNLAILHTSVLFDNISNEFAFYDAGTKVKVNVTIFIPRP